MFIYPYRTGSKSVKGLKNALEAVVIKRENSKFKGSPNRLVINWGSSQAPDSVLRCNILNHPYNVAIAANKLKTFQELIFNDVATPPFTTSKKAAKEAIKLYGSVIFCRTTLTGNSGAGIVIATKPEEIVDAPLYTYWVDKKREYRIHVFDGKVIMQQIKAKKKGVDGDKYVHNHSNGYVFAFNLQEEIPECVVEESIKAVKALGLDFGAVDAMIDKDGNPYILEVNTAPGIEGTTLERYVEAIKDYVK